MKDSFEELSYARHAEELKQHAEGMSKADHARTWLQEDTVDAWRHLRGYSTLDALLACDPGAAWVTVGDGRYGKDARYLNLQGGKALATNINDTLLKEAAQAGYIDAYRVENAEKLSFADDEFDYALCKESYHHFPRPMVALYEMLRVSRKGIVLIEPNDTFLTDNPLAAMAKGIKLWLSRVLLGKDTRHQYEESGNYVFRLSKREVEKVALGLNLRCVAFKGFNDAYVPGVEREKLAEQGPLFRRVRFRIAATNLLTRLGIMDFGLLTAVILKEQPAPELERELRRQGFEVRLLEPNPYA